jgi:hypothetical protein
MKTYLMRIPEILKGISETLDITATLCDRSWVVFNDEGVKILFIFERDGTLIVSRNGVVSKQKWSYIKEAKAILIDNVEQSFLLHPAFIDNVIFALNQDGTQHHLFMIDQGQVEQFTKLTLAVLHQYFETKVAQKQLDLKRLEEEEQERINKKLAKDEIARKTASLRKKQTFLDLEIILVLFFIGACCLVPLCIFNLTTLIALLGILFCLIVFVFYCIWWKRREDKIYAEITKIENDIRREYNI